MKQILKIDGMHCNSCAMIIENELSEKQGIKKVRASFSKEIVEVDFDENKISKMQIIEIIKKLGYKVKK